MELDNQHCYQVLRARDARFDGRLFVGVSTTGVYCRPICRVRTPAADRCSFYPNAASAEAAGYRPCLRCRPELAPGLSPQEVPEEIARRAIARICDGALSQGSVDELASQLGVGARQLRRLVERSAGVSPIQLAQTRRLLLAKQLLQDTRLPLTQVAEASGFGSLRRFNHAFRSRYGLAPRELRRRAARPGDEQALSLALDYRRPLAWPELAAFLGSRGASRIEQCVDGRYLRTVRIGAQRGWVAIQPVRGRDRLELQIAPSLLPELPALLAALRRLLDLDASPEDIDAHLGTDPLLAPLVAARPGLRVPGALEPFEVALRAIIGQQVSVKAATTVFSRFVERFGEPVATPFAGLDRLAPRAEDLADADLATLCGLGLNGRRAETIQGLAKAMSAGGLVLAHDRPWAEVVASLQALPGIGPWTAQYIAMRVLRDPDALPDSDLGLYQALQLRSPRAVRERAEAWRPWRAYAGLHLWTGLGSGG